jgi:hypothetical protein
VLAGLRGCSFFQESWKFLFFLCPINTRTKDKTRDKTNRRPKIIMSAAEKYLESPKKRMNKTPSAEKAIA